MLGEVSNPYFASWAGIAARLARAMNTRED
jgi:hypothetical protein